MFRLLAAQFGGLLLWAVVLGAAALVLWRRGLRLRGSGLFAAGLLLASCGYIILIDKAAPFEADRYYVIIYAAVVLAVSVVLAKLAANKDAPLTLALALVPILAAHFLDPNGYLFEQYAPRTPALAETASLPAVVLNKAGYEVAPDLFITEFAQREAVYQADGRDDAASLQNAAATHDLTGGFVLYGYIYNADDLLTLAESALPIARAELLTDTARCPVYYIKLK